MMDTKENKIPDLYQIKWRRVGTKKWKYGIVDSFSDDAQKAWRESRAFFVEDAVLPTGDWVFYDRDEIVPIEFSSEWDEENQCMKDEYSLYVAKEYRKAQENSEKATGLVGKMFSVGVADGSAHYVVVKENKKSVKIEWRGFCPDRWTDAMMGWGGTFPKDRIAQLVHRQEGLAALFAAHREGVEA